MADPHAAAVRSALRMNREQGLLADRLGNATHPRGSVLTAYRNALRALQSVLASGVSTDRAWRMQEVLRALRMDVALATQGVLEDAARLGSHQAVLQLAAYGVDVGGRSETVAHGAAAEGLQAVLAILDAQIQTALALAITGADATLITGSPDRGGAVQPAPVLSSAWFWIGTAALAAFSFVASAWSPREEVYFKQAVAAIDERTTDCCLRVHGQAVQLNKKFHLTGQPRFAEHVSNPPFHWNCRSATALVRPEDVGDELSAEMLAAARAELDARERTGGRQEIHPASATSRR